MVPLFEHDDDSNSVMTGFAIFLPGQTLGRNKCSSSKTKAALAELSSSGHIGCLEDTEKH